jgi:putative DNA-invertase from lambdoid prophage Rac
MKMGLYARVSTHDQQTLALQRNAMVAYAQQRSGSIVALVEDVGSGVHERLRREELMRAARRREIDAIVVWRLDRWGRSLADLVRTLQELHELGVGFISLGEALDFTTPTGRAMAGMLAVFAEFERGILRERVKAGIADARRRGTRHGRPPTVAHQAEVVRQLYAEGLSKSAIARRLGIGRTSVRRFLPSTAVRRAGRRRMISSGQRIKGSRSPIKMLTVHFPALTPGAPGRGGAVRGRGPAQWRRGP